MRIGRSSTRLGLLALALVAGCGDKPYPVKGSVVFEDGTPATELAGYLVSFQSQEHQKSATGVIRPDGSFTVGTQTNDDGAMRGKQRVAITPPPPEVDRPKPPLKIPARFGSFETSQLEVDIKADTNEIVLKVERAKK